MGGSGSRALVLPTPGAGALGVGCADLMVDSNGQDTGIFCRVFYPTDRKTEDLGTASLNLPIWIPRREYVAGLAAYKKQSPRKFHLVFDWLVGEYRAPAVWHDRLAAPSNDEQSKFPVVIFSHGLSACRHFYSAYCSALASHGFVVVAVEHRDRSACWTYTLEKDAEGNYQEKPIIMRQLEPDEKEFKLRNPQLHKRVSECVKALHLMEEMNLGQCGSAEQKLRGSKIILGQDFDWTQFKGRLDISRAAVAGHSFGGATAIASTAISNDFQAAVVLDGWMMPIEWDLYAKAQQPLLFINAGVWQWTENVKRMLKFDKLVAERLMVTFRNVVHQSFTDFTYPCKGFVGKKMGFQGETEPVICSEAAVLMSVAFLRKHFGQTGNDDALPQLIKQYEAFALDGTTLNLDDVPTSSL